MQILQWLFKVVQEKQAREPTIATEKEVPDHAREELKEVVSCYHQKGHKRYRKHKGIELDCRDLNKYLAALFRRANSRDCFYSTLNLRRLNNCKNLVHHPRQLYIYSTKMKKEDIVRGLASIRHSKSASPDQLASSSSSAATAHLAGSKVLPISDNSTSSSTRTHKENDHNDHADSSDQKNGKTKALSRMKELLRWAASAKSQKGGKYIGRKVLHFRNKGNLRGLPSGDGELASDSPKISFRWDMESCSRTSSAISASSMLPSMNADRSDRLESDPRKGNWITNDDEFVVLEL